MRTLTIVVGFLVSAISATGFSQELAESEADLLPKVIEVRCSSESARNAAYSAIRSNMENGDPGAVVPPALDALLACEELDDSIAVMSYLFRGVHRLGVGQLDQALADFAQSTRLAYAPDFITTLEQATLVVSAGTGQLVFANDPAVSGSLTLEALSLTEQAGQMDEVIGGLIKQRLRPFTDGLVPKMIATAQDQINSEVNPFIALPAGRYRIRETGDVFTVTPLVETQKNELPIDVLYVSGYRIVPWNIQVSMNSAVLFPLSVDPSELATGRAAEIGSNLAFTIAPSRRTLTVHAGFSATPGMSTEDSGVYSVAASRASTAGAFSWLAGVDSGIMLRLPRGARLHPTIGAAVYVIQNASTLHGNIATDQYWMYSGVHWGFALATIGLSLQYDFTSGFGVHLNTKLAAGYGAPLNAGDNPNIPERAFFFLPQVGAGMHLNF